jgi:hypothetical protein
LRPPALLTISLILILGLGIAVRLRQFSHAASFWYDEAFLLLILPGRSLAEYAQPLPYNIVAPPLYLWLNGALAAVAGITDELAMRLPALVAGLAALMLMAPLAGQITNRAGTLFAVACAGLSMRSVTHSSEVRPYTIDMFLVELVIGAAILALSPNGSNRSRTAGRAGLLALAIVGPWLSFPSVFALAGTSVAIIFLSRRADGQRDWPFWLTFNAVAAISGLAVWYFFARHMYYPGMIEHWGHRGWGGFPDKSSVRASLMWIAMRPYSIMQYANQDVGWTLVILSIWGGVVLFRSNRMALTILIAPFIVALVAALLGKYPLADRTQLFLVPCGWLLAGVGVGDLIGRKWGRLLVAIATGNLVLNLFKIGILILSPLDGMDYRGAYQLVNEHAAAEDVIWDQMGVVYKLYHGDRPNVYFDRPAPAYLAATRRAWLIGGGPVLDEVHREMEAAGGNCIWRRSFSQVEIRLFAPGVATPE